MNENRASETVYSDNNLQIERELSYQLQDLHVYVVPVDLWRTHLQSAVNYAINDSISAGFIRVRPEQTIHSLREEIENQISSDVVPREYVFLKCVGRCFTRIKPKQEITLKVKTFLPPQTFTPEIYIIELNCDLKGMFSSSSSSVQSRGNQINNGHQSVGRRLPPFGSIDDNEIDELIPSNGMTRRRRDISPLSRSYGNRNKSKENQLSDRGQWMSYTSPRGSPTHFDSEPNSSNMKHARRTNGGSLPSLVGTSDVSKNKLAESDGRKQKQKDRELYLPLSATPTNSPRSRRKEVDKKNGPQSHSVDENMPFGATPTHSPRTRNRRKDVGKKNGPQSQAVDEKTEPQLDDEERKQLKEILRQRDDEERRKNFIRKKRDSMMKQKENGEQNNIESKRSGQRDGRNDQIDGNEKEKNQKSQRDERERIKKEEKRLELIKELEKLKASRLLKEQKRDELMKTAKTLQTKSHNYRNVGRDEWKKKYFEEKKKTPSLDEECLQLKRRLDAIQKKTLSHVETTTHPATSRAAPLQPSPKNNLKLQAMKIQHDMETLQQRLDDVKMKLTAEMKLRNQAEKELRYLRSEVSQKKIQSHMNHLHQRQAFAEQQIVGVAPTRT